MKKENQPMVSIVIPTLNEEKYLPKLLKDLQRQTFKDYEIIIADADSKDKTRDIAKKFKCKIVQGGLHAVGRNNGGKVAKGDRIYFFDADVRLPYNYLEKTLKEINKRKLDVSVCDVELITNNPANYIIWEISNIFIRLNQYNKKKAGGYGASINVSQKFFKKSGGFNEKTIFAEDAEFIAKCVQKGAKFRVLNSSYIKTDDRRLKKEGTFKFVYKSLMLIAYRTMFGEVKHNFAKYEFGNYSKPTQSRIAKQLKKLRIKISKTPKDKFSPRDFFFEMLDILKDKIK